ncbi:hypothetical protein DMN91_003843 [Ooceraea biroi]|uniref:F-box/LRR-repeat protein n=1 Tax=Ooceraea biroi TaxID=2015173 RepID=A0A026X0C2_OOCBI|nr:uncharacterized protein LOC113561731 [Ooceraea biroi]EZA61456.1 hypothetical protein X777_07789 [Ooceraea biroi]RLU23637.1 hypothetical protein DMN91_003843 [Ooceraea biroi]
MPSHRQPNSLEGLSLGRVCRQLNETCRYLQMLSQKSSATQVLALAKRTIRPYYINALPTHLRSRVIDEAMKTMCSPSSDESTLVSAPAALYLLALLLDPNIKKLKVGLCCYYGCSHQTCLLKLFASEGVGLRSLQLSRSALLRLDCKLLYSALLNMKNLSRLTLRNIADDGVLQAIGKTCPKLAVLDVACSRQVTDIGLRQLLLRVELRDKPRSTSSQERTSWSRLKRLLSVLKSKSSRREKQSVVLEFHESRNPLCDTLGVLNVANTGVTSAGVLFALANVPHLKSLAEYSHMGRVMEIMNGGLIDRIKIPFSLTQARSCKTTLNRIELLAQACPKMEKLHISEPHHSPEALGLFPYITSLSIHNVPMKREWLNGFYNYLRRNGQNLYDLNFQMTQSENPLQVDLREILNSCPNLHVLITSGANVTWMEGCDPPPLKYLKVIQLGRMTNALAIVKILSLVPELKALHVYSCLDLSDKHLETLKPPTKSKSTRKFDMCDDSSSNLTCFYIYEMHKVSLITVLNMFNNYKQLRQFGNLTNWTLNREDAKMLRTTRTSMDVDFCSGSHWLWNNCIPIL